MHIPGAENDYLSDHVELLLSSYEKITGRQLLETSGDSVKDAKLMFESPFFVASHDTRADPVLTYGNQTALDLFEMTWNEFTATPSRFTAETPERSERERLLEAVRANGFIDDYSGIRISKSGRRFWIKQATVWNLLDESGRHAGQAATFHEWEPIQRNR